MLFRICEPSHGVAALFALVLPRELCFLTSAMSVHCAASPKSNQPPNQIKIIHGMAAPAGHSLPLVVCKSHPHTTCWSPVTRCRLSRRACRCATTVQLLADTATGQVAYGGYREAIRAIFRDEGARGFYKGMSASYWGCSEGCLYFVLYERIKR